MSKGELWSGRKVAQAREYIRPTLPRPCWLCGLEVGPDESWVVEHKIPRSIRPDLTFAPDNWAASHRKCSDASGPKVASSLGAGSPGRRAPSFFSHSGRDLADIPDDLTGTTSARLFTPALNRLETRDETAGYECIEWVEEHLNVTLLEWQKWFLIHALELKPDGSFRFSTLLLLVSRQNGKTTVIEALTSWLLATRPDTLVLGTSTAQELAREPWSRVADHCLDLGIASEKTIKRGALDTSIRTVNGSRYKVAAATRRGGRSLSVDLLILDELREMLDDWDAYNALSGTTTAKPNALTLCLSNAGDVRSVVLNGLRDSALDGADTALGIFEWSAPEGAELDDLEATAQANPALGVTITAATLNSKRSTLPESGYRTEHLCQRVDSIEPGDALIEPDAWAALAVELPTEKPDAVAVESWFGDGCSVASAWRSDGFVTVSVTDWPDLPSAAAYVRSTGYTGLLACGASLANDPAFYGMRLKPENTRATQAVTEASRLLQEGALRHTDDALTPQVLNIRTQIAGADGVRVTSKGRADAIKAAVWAARAARKPNRRPIVALPKSVSN